MIPCEFVCTKHNCDCKVVRKSYAFAEKFGASHMMNEHGMHPVPTEYLRQRIKVVKE